MMEARLMWTHQKALERRGAVALARLGGHAFPVDDATRVRQRMPAHRPSLVISLGMLSSSYRSLPFRYPFYVSPVVCFFHFIQHCSLASYFSAFLQRCLCPRIWAKNMSSVMFLGLKR